MNKALWIGGLGLLGAVACSAGSDDRSGGTVGGAGPITGNPSAPGGGAAPSNPGLAGTPATGASEEPADGFAGDVTAKFIWIANSDEGTVSKLNTETMEEVGRYVTSPTRSGRPSRTSVGADGAVAVAMRGPSETGVTKILPNTPNNPCPDLDGDGTVETSTGRNDVLAWGSDECIAWHLPLNYQSTRPVAWAPSPNPDGGPVVWTSGTTTCSSTSCGVDVIRIDGMTGNVLDTITVNGLTGPDMLTAGQMAGLNGTSVQVMSLATAPPNPFAGVFGPTQGDSTLPNYGAYGGAADGLGNFWMFIANTTQLVRIDAVSLEARMWPVPGGNGYGMTVDSQGRVFICGALGVSRFDPASQMWASDTGAVALGFNGCMTDGEGTLWVGGGADFGQDGLHAYSTETMQHTASFGPESGLGAIKGVSIDFDGNVWGVAIGTTAYRLNPATGEVRTYNQLVGAYSYSDMTGFGLKIAGAVPII